MECENSHGYKELSCYLGMVANRNTNSLLTVNSFDEEIATLILSFTTAQLRNPREFG